MADAAGRGIAAVAAGRGIAAVAAGARALAVRWNAAVAVTLGSRGAVLAANAGTPLVVPALAAAGGDPCGAGDRFSATAAEALAGGATLSEAVQEAVRRASAFVASGGAWAAAQPTFPRSAASAEAVVERARAAGATVVATGGCFDLLHAGHVAMLYAARRLGDCLVVCLNSDASVRRLKGPGRPLEPEATRAAALLALDCVDAVVVFDHDTPAPTLARLRPDLFAKGGDYATLDLPEAEVMARWGGTAAVVPYLAGHSTTALSEEALRRAT